AHRCEALNDLCLGAEQQKGSADADAVARAQPTDLHHRAVDPRAVGAFQIGEDHLAVVELHLGVEPAHALVVETKDIALFSADAKGRGQLAKRAALVNPFQHLKGYGWHETAPAKLLAPACPRARLDMTALLRVKPASSLFPPTPSEKR